MDTNINYGESIMSLMFSKKEICSERKFEMWNLRLQAIQLLYLLDKFLLKFTFERKFFIEEI